MRLALAAALALAPVGRGPLTAALDAQGPGPAPPILYVWSPDGAWMAFVEGEELLRADLAGAREVLLRAPEGERADELRVATVDAETGEVRELAAPSVDGDVAWMYVLIRRMLGWAH